LSSEPTFAPAADEDPIERLIEKEKGQAEGLVEDITTKTKKIEDDDYMDKNWEATA
jgi:hypothetical protein